MIFEGEEGMSTSSTTESCREKSIDKNLIKDNLKSLGEYNREVSQHFSKEFFKKEPMRLKYAALYYGVIFSSIYTITQFELHWGIKLVIGMIMGIALGGNAFLAHEVLHGAIVRNKKVQQFFGFFGFLPYLISPTYWQFWHNKLHHGNTQLLYKDPDAFPTHMIWKRSKFMKFVFPLSPGSKTIRSYFYFFYWFSFQAILNQVYMRFGNKMWAKMNHTRVTIEFILQVAIMGSYFYFIGVENIVFLFVIPFMIQNYTVMSYISTNHNMSPYTKINDPLLNSLSVTNNPFLEFVHLNFGYHTEHHLFPNMPMSRAKEVSEKLKELYPDRYMIMSKKDALKKLYATPRIYKNREVLIHPVTKKEYATLKHDMLN